VNGHEITRDDVEKAYRRAAPDNQTPSEEEAYTAKLNLLSEMIVQDILLTKAAQLKNEVPTSEVDNAYNEAKKNIPPAAVEEELKKRTSAPTCVKICAATCWRRRWSTRKSARRRSRATPTSRRSSMRTRHSSIATRMPSASRKS
jgi:hypothetical protein